jgi:hypothetical protein
MTMTWRLFFQDLLIFFDATSSKNPPERDRDRKMYLAKSGGFERF